MLEAIPFVRCFNVDLHFSVWLHFRVCDFSAVIQGHKWIDHEGHILSYYLYIVKSTHTNTCMSAF